MLAERSMALAPRLCRLWRWTAGICGEGIWEYWVAAVWNFSRIDPFRSGIGAETWYAKCGPYKNNRDDRGRRSRNFIGTLTTRLKTAATRDRSELRQFTERLGADYFTSIVRVAVLVLPLPSSAVKV